MFILLFVNVLLLIQCHLLLCFCRDERVASESNHVCLNVVFNNRIICLEQAVVTVKVKHCSYCT